MIIGAFSLIWFYSTVSVHLHFGNGFLRILIRSKRLRHISVEHRKRFVFAVSIYVTFTDEINTKRLQLNNHHV